MTDLIKTGEMTTSAEKTCQMPQAIVAAKIVKVSMWIQMSRSGEAASFVFPAYANSVEY